MSDGIKVIARNRKAGFDYHLERRYEAGIVLTGAEIKSIRANRINLQDGFVEFRDNELWMLNVHIQPYEQAGRYGYVEPMRPRKLLLHKKQIAEIIDWIDAKGHSCVPTMVYLSKGRAKFEIALAKGKKQFDKRDSIAKRDAEREIRQALKERSRDL
jgi:SsrA-binding protein